MNHYDIQISNEEQRLSEVKLQMEELRLIFKLEMAEYAKKWFQDESKRIIIADHERSTGLGSEILKQVKVDVMELVANTPQLIDKHFDKKEIWWHFTEEYIYVSHNKNFPSHVTEEIKYLLGNLAPIFVKYELVKITYKDLSNHFTFTEEVNRQFQIDSLKRKNEPYYRFGITLNDKINEISKQYGKRLDNAKILQENIKKLNNNKRDETLSDMWDSI